jgi:hypothetical protein
LIDDLLRPVEIFLAACERPIDGGTVGNVPQVCDLVRKLHGASFRAQMRCVLHLAQLTLSFRQSLIIRHFLHQRGNGTTESLV